MNTRIKKLWIADLKANGRIQGKNRLRSVNGRYCCLGRLCELAVKEGIIPVPKLMDDINGGGTRAYAYGPAKGTASILSMSELPAAVVAWAELDEPDPLVNVDENQSLSELNDAGSTFAEIAKIIDREL